MDTPKEEDQIPTLRQTPAFVVRNREVLLALTELGNDIDEILGEGAFAQIVEILKWNEYYKSWDKARELAYAKARQSEGEVRSMLFSLRQLSLVMKEHENHDIRNLADYFFNQNL